LGGIGGFDFGEKAIAATRDGLDEARAVRGIAETSRILLMAC